MSGRDFTPDPITLDLIDSADGWFKEDETASFAAVCQLTHHLDASVVTPNEGSILHQLWDFGGDELGAEGLRVEAIRSLRVLEAPGLVANVEATALLPETGKVYIETSYRDTATGARVDQEASPPTGGT